MTRFTLPFWLTIALMTACSGDQSIDDDGDGWTDRDDPVCVEATIAEDDGYITGDEAPQCNDGIDNDNDGLVDALELSWSL